MAILDAAYDSLAIWILQELCGHTATVCVVHQDGGMIELKTYERREDPNNGSASTQTASARRSVPHKSIHYSISANGEKVYALASGSKILSALTAHATANVNPQYKRLYESSVHEAYNAARHGDMEEMVMLPGNPTTMHLLLHCKGVDSSNDRTHTPESRPYMTANDLVQALPGLLDRTAQETPDNESWFSYSNANFTIVQAAMEACLGKSVIDVMQEILFDPLGMNSSLLGSRKETVPSAGTYVATADRMLHEVSPLEYGSKSALLLAMGANCTPRDLAQFFLTVLQTYYENPAAQKIPGIDKKSIRVMLADQVRDKNKVPFYCGLGLLTSLQKGGIGEFSINRRKFPEKKFSRQSVLPHKDILACSMTGSSIGSSSAYVTLPDHGITVFALVNTSGPVDIAHYLVLAVLRKMFCDEKWYSGDWSRMDIKSMVSENWDAAVVYDREFNVSSSSDSGPPAGIDVRGTYSARDYNQVLEIRSGDDGGLTARIGGNKIYSQCCKLLWIDKSTFRLLIEPHFAIDAYEFGDWANRTFRIINEHQKVIRIERLTGRSSSAVFERQ